jgi:hypothetical protein
MAPPKKSSAAEPQEPAAEELPPVLVDAPPPAPLGARYFVTTHVVAFSPQGRSVNLAPGDEFPATTWLAPGELEGLLASGALLKREG